MRTKDKWTAEHLLRLPRESPALLAVLATIDQLAIGRSMPEPTITSIFRDAKLGESDTGIHGLWRAADLRVWNRERDGRDIVHTAKGDQLRATEITKVEWLVLIPHINALFRYGRKWGGLGPATDVAHLRDHGDNPNTHVHIQVPRTAHWK